MFASVAGSRVHNVSHNIDVDLGDFDGHSLVKKKGHHTLFGSSTAPVSPVRAHTWL